jgi:hypothetical protein
MNSHLMRGLAALIAVATSAPAWADHGIAGGLVSGSGPILTAEAETLPAGKYSAGLQVGFAFPDAYTDGELITLAGQHVHADTTDYNLRAAASLSYGVTGHLMLSASLPFVRRDDLREGHHSHSGGTASYSVEELGSVAGVGDASLMGQYVLAHDHQQGWLVSLLGGLKLPTGSTAETDLAGTRLETEHQPGTGSWDPLLGLAAQKRWGDTAFHASALYQFATTGAQDTRMGDRLNLGAALVFDLSAHHENPQETEAGHEHADHPAWAAMIETSYEWEGQREVAGETDGDSGGKVLWLSPGLRFTAPAGWSAGFSVGLPVWQDVGISHPDNGWRALIQVGTAL